MSQDKARLRAMQAIGKLLPADDSGKMEERAIKGYIELLEIGNKGLGRGLSGAQEIWRRDRDVLAARIDKAVNLFKDFAAHNDAESIGNVALWNSVLSALTGSDDL